MSSNLPSFQRNTLPYCVPIIQHWYISHSLGLQILGGQYYPPSCHYPSKYLLLTNKSCHSEISWGGTIELKEKADRSWQENNSGLTHLPISFLSQHSAFQTLKLSPWSRVGWILDIIQSLRGQHNTKMKGRSLQLLL